MYLPAGVLAFTSGIMTHVKTVIKQASVYSRKMDRLSKRIFGEIPYELTARNARVVKAFQAMPYEEDEFCIAYFPPHPMFHSLTKLLRLHGLFRDEHQDFIDELLRQRCLRGKAPPKPGEGKHVNERSCETPFDVENAGVPTASNFGELEKSRPKIDALQQTDP
ncbi:Small ribosomal subunit protein [Trichinella spiralis]|uniref:Small ribosomal subunit protein mS33 n=1 Tax=Trichinella spiralis TaxID=6334 RepID=A0ABR3K7X0_TRISP